MGETHEATASDKFTHGPIAQPRIERNLVMTPEADEFLSDLSRKTGLTEGNVLRLALTLFKAAVEAREQGKHVGFAETSDSLDVELVGF